MRRYLLLGFWIIGIIFPMIWLTGFSPTFARLFDTLFEPAWVHVVMHTLLFGVLAYLVLLFLPQKSTVPLRWHTVVLVIGVVLLVAFLQESFQLLYMGRMPGADELFDLGVDLSGGLLGLMIGWHFTQRIRQRE